MRLLIGMFLVMALGAQGAEATIQLSPRPVRVMCRAVSTSNITKTGNQVVDGIPLSNGDVACLVGQSDNKNGAYVVRSAAWQPADPGMGSGLELYALQGAANASSVYGCDTQGAIVWGTTSTVFTKKSGAGGPFDPLAPGPIGTGTPNVVRTSQLQLPSGSATAVAGVTTLLGGSNIVSFVDEHGNREAFRLPGAFVGGAGTSQINHFTRTVRLADSTAVDFAPGLGGMARIAMMSGTGALGYFLFANDGTTSSDGVNHTNFSTTLGTSGKLNAGKFGSSVRVENRTGSQADILMSVDYVDSY